MKTQYEMASQYDPKNVERRLYDGWMEMDAFKADPHSKKPKYVMVLPPPNVTGFLHIGHALTCTLEDILARRKRMLGFNTLWLPGTDHAGIATQMVVERNLKKESGVTRHDIGRKQFLEKVWEWKDRSQGTIISQLKMMGCSLDWSRLSFTLDPEISRAVRETFVRLYKDGLIYRGEAMVSWDPVSRTALSDLEVKFSQVKGKLWQLKYVSKDNPKEYLTVATTRPETLFGDTAVAVNPDDKRYAHWIGKTVIVPICNREVPVIADAYVDAKFGTGALKVTPAHDTNDFEIGRRHKLPMVDVMDDKASMNENAGAYRGLTREDARQKVVDEARDKGLLLKEEDHVHNVSFSDRTGVPVEPRLSTQWYVNAAELAKDAITAVEKGEIKIVPQEWEKTYFEWMRNIRPWCISRQLWWGHQIPVWYCSDCKHEIVAIDDPTDCDKCGSKKLRQDEDVLDTWFSSGLWPFSTLGWPKDTADMRAFYPNDILETGFDILFFWVARMIMLGKRMTGQFPFHTVYLHPMVRDEYGQKMSKTKGNVKDPLEIIEQVGADALRFTLAAQAVHGRDVLLSDARIEGYRNFMNKLWNASRFVLMHFSELKEVKVDRTNEINRWIWSRLNRCKADVNQALDQYRFFDAANRLYHFVWSDYCDWFLEFIKPELDERKKKGDSTAVQVLDEALRLLHPIAPFITEELWQRLPLKGAQITICHSDYPTANEQHDDIDCERRIGRLIATVEAIRSKRGECNVSPAVEIEATIVAEKNVLEELVPLQGWLERLSKVKNLSFENPGVARHKQNKIVVPVSNGNEAFEVWVPREQLIQIDEERVRTSKELEGVRGELERANAKLKNQSFLGKAPSDVVQGVKERKAALEKTITSLEDYLKSLD
jgi:valyl-tRNA synthetase